MEVTTTYRIRPHHGMCLYFFEGKGYSEGFTKHMAEVKEWLPVSYTHLTLPTT